MQKKNLTVLGLLLITGNEVQQNSQNFIKQNLFFPFLTLSFYFKVISDYTLYRESNFVIINKFYPSCEQLSCTTSSGFYNK